MLSTMPGNHYVQRKQKKTRKPKPQRLKTFVVLTLLFEIDLHPKVRQIFSLFPDIKNYIYITLFNSVNFSRDFKKLKPIVFLLR